MQILLIDMTIHIPCDQQTGPLHSHDEYTYPSHFPCSTQLSNKLQTWEEKLLSPTQQVLHYPSELSVIQDLWDPLQVQEILQHVLTRHHEIYLKIDCTVSCQGIVLVAEKCLPQSRELIRYVSSLPSQAGFCQ